MFFLISNIFFWFFKKRNTYERELVDQISTAYLENSCAWAFWMPKEASFYDIYDDFGHFLIFNFCSNSAVKKCSRVIFTFLTKIWLKTCITPPKLKILNLTFFDLVTSDDLDLTQCHKRHKRVLKSIPDTIHVVPSDLFQCDTAALPGEADNDLYSNGKIDPTWHLWYHQWR